MYIITPKIFLSSKGEKSLPLSNNHLPSPNRGTQTTHQCLWNPEFVPLTLLPTKKSKLPPVLTKPKLPPVLVKSGGKQKHKKKKRSKKKAIDTTPRGSDRHFEEWSEGVISPSVCSDSDSSNSTVCDLDS